MILLFVAALLVGFIGVAWAVIRYLDGLAEPHPSASSALSSLTASAEAVPDLS